MHVSQEPPIDWLRRRYSYDSSTGIVYSNIASSRSRVGDPVGFINRYGYLATSFVYYGQSHFRLVHRIAWALFHGDWPGVDMEVDHINRVRSDNRISNLRLADDGLTARNASKVIKSEYDETGYSQVNCSGTYKYQAQIKSKGRSIYLGLYGSKVEAVAAYKGAKRALA